MSKSRQRDSGCGWGRFRHQEWGELDDYDRASIAVDPVVFTIRERQLFVLVHRRTTAPFRDHWALPGGMVSYPEHPRDALRKHLKAKAGFGWDGDCEAFAVLNDNPNAPGGLRDPRGWVVALAYLLIVPWARVKADTASTTHDVAWLEVEVPPIGDQVFEEVTVRYSVGNKVSLAFDHERLVALALRRLRRDCWDRDVALGFMPETFTLRQLQDIIETLYGPGGGLNRATFRRHVLEVQQWVEATGVEFHDVTGVFAGHEVCGTLGEWINGPSISFRNSVRRGKPALTDHSFHPNVLGQQAYAMAVNQLLGSA